MPAPRDGEARSPQDYRGREKAFFADNLLVRILFIIVIVRRTGLAPWEFQFPFPGILTSTFLATEEAISYKTAPPWDPTVALYLGPYGDPRGVGVRARYPCSSLLRRPPPP